MEYTVKTIEVIRKSGFRFPDKIASLRRSFQCSRKRRSLLFFRVPLPKNQNFHLPCIPCPPVFPVSKTPERILTLKPRNSPMTREKASFLSRNRDSDFRIPSVLRRNKNHGVREATDSFAFSGAFPEKTKNSLPVSPVYFRESRVKIPYQKTFLLIWIFSPKLINSPTSIPVAFK